MLHSPQSTGYIITGKPKTVFKSRRKNFYNENVSYQIYFRGNSYELLLHGPWPICANPFVCLCNICGWCCCKALQHSPLVFSPLKLYVVLPIFLRTAPTHFTSTSLNRYAENGIAE